MSGIRRLIPIRHTAKRTIGRLDAVRWLMPIVVALTVISPATVAQASQPATLLTVIGTDTLHLRDCPSTGCDVTASAPLGATLEPTGEPEDGFVPVAWEGHEGWAYETFLAVDDEVDLVREGVPGCNRVALIFNAGIGETPSETILDTLVGSQAPATLFAMGWWAEAHPDYLHRLASEGNVVIGSHGDTQTFLTDATNEEIVAEVDNSAATIETVLDYPPARYFTPYATDSDARVQRVIAEQGYLPLAWTAAAGDYDADDTAAGVYENVMSGAGDGAILELHLDGPATEESTAVALPSIIRDLEARGYTLVTVPEILLPCPNGS
jgi:peptidoglycan/xylan/chitin deacetylase (PgdA/CDA1 family)